MGRITETVKVLIICNVLFFVGSLLIGDVAFNLLSIWFPENNNFHYWQILTHMFMHSKDFILHIVFNMFALYMFGSPLETIWGRNKFIFFYFSCGLGSLLLTIGIDYFNFESILNILSESGFSKSQVIETMNSDKYYPIWKEILGQEKFQQLFQIFHGNALGASGAIMGLLVAFGIFFPTVPLMLIFLPIPIKAKYFIPILLCYEIIAGFTGGTTIFGVNVGHWAHVGGALTGAIMAYYWKKNSFNDRRWN